MQVAVVVLCSVKFVNNMSRLKVKGFDFSETTIEVSKLLYPQINYKKFDLVKDVPNQNFDLVFCTQVLEHILQPEIAFRNLILMTKSSGKLLITVPNGRTIPTEGTLISGAPKASNISLGAIHIEIVKTINLTMEKLVLAACLA